MLRAAALAIVSIMKPVLGTPQATGVRASNPARLSPPGAVIARPGERSVLSSFHSIADATATVDATGDPEPALDDAVESFWTVQLRVP